jgi:putative oxidoreductase
MRSEPMRHLGLLMIRVTAGLLFAVHGYAKLFGGDGKAVHPKVKQYLGEGFAQAVARGGPSNFSRGLERMRVPAPAFMAYVVGGTEFIGGLMLITGTLTRLAAFGLAVSMVFAIKLAHWKQGMIGSASGYMYALSMLGSMLGLLFLGAGAVSADHKAGRLLRNRRGSRGQSPRPEGVGEPSGFPTSKVSRGQRPRSGRLGS